MRSRARMAGHAIHPMLIAFPLGLLVTAVLFDLLFFATDRDSFAVAAAHTTAVGVVGGAVAGLFGWVDWFAVPNGTRAKRIGLVHGLTNVVVLVLFAVSWVLRLGQATWQPPILAFVLAVAGLALATFSAWLGGELVERLGMSVDEGANLNAPSSLARPTH
ncbi:putative membrane protein [Streptoalloteichus tenebrarius]|uniref:Membrane protein n=1 Tax=Streptoalloteichus tenebrarius (strain ATCC 17920 / DSM 40477 / JCM 4838 / CBS 697.72 / NBRC 16177 / NCIMB 11028 / NRRL B-12390 / A12253. 1 / ISP 5477) TaxID=1933 RepID=A0ABT1HTE9_STRSD|nr:DUF2231 domain-containing protein [Streptoalloteichus tenebrarius]MCP2258784.1 putative membrane protein [Streptoalloteichus tenebrarius]BFE99539.1 DUF2231 domain-containing protein [Streptoalloteichus tenebrarius]